MDAFIPDQEEVQNFAVAVLVTAAGLIAFYREFAVFSVIALFLTALTALFARETGQRLVAQLMKAKVKLEISKAGIVVSLGAALVAVITDAPVLFLIPVYSTFSVLEHKQWGYDIPVIWSKREAWIAGAGAFFMLSLAGIAYLLESYVVSRSLALFCFFQMIPLKDTVLSDNTDGAYLLLQSGFMWLLLTALSILGIIFPL